LPISVANVARVWSPAVPVSRGTNGRTPPISAAQIARLHDTNGNGFCAMA
jgi:hypothetical protein